MKFGFRVSLFLLSFLGTYLVACTDYVAQIDEKIEKREAYDRAWAAGSVLTADYRVAATKTYKSEFVDSRDGRSYKAITIGSQTWMAENLNYKVAGSYCYNNEDSSCTKYGRLYTWASAMDSAGLFSSNGKDCGYGKVCIPTFPIRGVCPDGWHLPSYGDWETLFIAAGRDVAEYEFGFEGLQSDTGWNDNRGGGSSVDYGFSILPGGARMKNEQFYYASTRAYFWLAQEGDANKASVVVWKKSRGSISDDDKSYGFSIRCVKDVADENPVKFSSSSKVKSSSSSKEKSCSSVEKRESSNSDKAKSGDSPMSNSVRFSSSSESSSSVVIVEPCKFDDVDVCEYGSLIDERDGRTYKTVIIGSQTWMAENLNYEIENSYCSENNVARCEVFGRLYKWAVAMDSVGTFGSNGEGCGYGKDCFPTYPVRGICPKGWHLPDSSEWERLFTAVYGKITAGKVLKTASYREYGWKGTDAYGFSALPAGSCDYGEGGFNCNTYMHHAYFWSSTEPIDSKALYPDHAVRRDSYEVYILNLNGYEDSADLSSNSKDRMCSIRCVKD